MNLLIEQLLDLGFDDPHVYSCVEYVDVRKVRFDRYIELRSLKRKFEV